jgi:hypothetical protein
MCIRKMADAIANWADGDAASAQSRRRSADGTGAGRGPPMGPPEIITNVLNQKGRNCNYRAVSLETRRAGRRQAAGTTVTSDYRQIRDSRTARTEAAPAHALRAFALTGAHPTPTAPWDS